MALLIKEKKNKRPPFILTSPHSGVKFPDNFFENKIVNFDKEKLLMVSDLFVDELIENKTIRKLSGSLSSAVLLPTNESQLFSTLNSILSKQKKNKFD